MRKEMWQRTRTDVAQHYYANGELTLWVKRVPLFILPYM